MFFFPVEFFAVICLAFKNFCDVCELNVDGTYTLDDSDYEEITINASTKIVRMDEDRDEISRYVDNTTTDLSINDLKDAKNYGEDCSKVLVCSSKGTAKLIVIYN